jgi:plasmid stabilization system protein ParE
MADKVKLSALAQKDLEKSAGWYEEQQPGLGEVFAEAIYKAAIAISKNLTAYPVKKANTREFALKKYPFIIVYQDNSEADFIKILRIFHTSRNPKFKYKGTSRN